MSRFKPMLFPAATVLAAMTCLPAAAQTATSAAPGAGTSGQGVVVVRDAETGQVRAPTAAEMRALQPSPSASAKSSAAMAPPVMVTGPGGRRSVRLDERQMVYSVVTRGPDGKPEERCVAGNNAGAKAAERALSRPAPATKPKEHRHEDH